ncbi:hypothetical protein [Nereida sp. MMG025]|nr:hypothetical protein [Nereida sp. MMG025]
MIADVKQIIERSSGTLLTDLAGAAALTVIFSVALCLPNFF